MARRPRVLDLFCGGGAASDGYVRAGYDVVGVDIDRQPAYPHPFIRADALELLARGVHGFDLVHASPPCQGYSLAVSSRSSPYVPTLGRDEPRLIAPVRELLQATGVPYVIENVRGARDELLHPVELCGAMFGLAIPRHRYMEAGGWDLPPLVHPPCRGMARAYAQAHGIEYRDMSVTGKGRHAGTAARWATLLGMGRVMRQHDYSEAIPPVYAEYIGHAFRVRARRIPMTSDRSNVTSQCEIDW